MTELFATVLKMSLTGSYVIAVVVLLRWLILRRLPKYYTFALWAVVLFRLLSPVSFTSAASIVPQSAVPMPGAANGAIATIMPNLNPAVVAPVTAAAAPGMMTVLSWVWAAGIVLLLCYSGVSCLRLHRRVAGAVHLEGSIYRSAAIDSPFVLGLIKPKIYLPPDIPSDELGYILRHEQIHIRRLDYLTKPLAFFTLCLHWFNPLCWLAFVLFGRDMEMSCDERVIRELGDSIRPNYSDSLLSMASKGSFAGGGPLAFGESGVGQRIKNVLNFRKPAFWLTLVALLAVALAVGGLATNPVENEDILQQQPKTIEPQSQPSQPLSTAVPNAPEPTAPIEDAVDDLAHTGLTQEENAELAAQKDRYEAMTPSEQEIAREGGTVGCIAFEHTWWEESVSIELIRYAEQVSGRSFDDWARPRMKTGECTSIYDLAREFDIDYEEFSEFIVKAEQTDLYPPEKIKPRFIYFGLPMNRNDVYNQKYISPIAVLAIFAYSWDSPEQIKPEDFTQFFLIDSFRNNNMPKYTFGGTQEEALAKYSDNVFQAASEDFTVAGIYVREQAMHDGVRAHFDVPVELIQKAPEYRPELKVYIYEDWGFGGGADARVVAVREEPNGVLALDFEVFGGAAEEIYYHGTVRVMVDRDNYKYLSCQYIDGA